MTPRPPCWSAGPTTPSRCWPRSSGRASVTEEFLDRWRTPGDRRSKQWEERFGELHYVALGTEAFKLALGQAGLGPEDVAQVVVSGTHARAVRQVAGQGRAPAPAAWPTT